jgi:hypothetical protein
MTARGLRLANPGNIRHGDAWRGLTADQPDPAFCQFSAPVYGIRAMAKILLSYQRRGIRTIKGIISAWAPPSENDTDAYSRDVAQRAGIFETDQIDVRDPEVCAALVKGIIWHENGSQPYSDNTINDGVKLAISN